MKTTIWTMLAVAALMSLTQPVRANLVSNGGFETGDFTGWTVTPAASGSFIMVFGSGLAHSGSNAAQFGGEDHELDTISQSLATVPGQAYEIEFWLRVAAFPPDTQMKITWDGVVVDDLIGLGVLDPGSGPSSFTRYAYTVTPTDASTELAFAGFNDGAFTSLDDIVVTAVTAVPEPFTASLAALALTGLALAATRRRSA